MDVSVALSCFTAPPGWNRQLSGVNVHSKFVPFDCSDIRLRLPKKKKTYNGGWFSAVEQTDINAKLLVNASQAEWLLAILIKLPLTLHSHFLGLLLECLREVIKVTLLY